jgi:hypothetical protein
MYKLFFYFTILFFSIFNSCNYSKGVKKDFNTGLSASYNGFAINDIYLTTGEKRLSNNKISLGQKIFLTATDIDNFIEINGKVFPGCTIILTDKTGKEILNLPDAFSEMINGTTKAEAKTLQATLTTGEPMVVGETYHLNVRFYDKNKKENEINANVDLVVQ